MKKIVKRDNEDWINYQILQYMADYGKPIGATTLGITIGKELKISQATIGRILMQFDILGYSSLEQRKGRILTSKGIEHLEYLKRKLKYVQSQTELIQEINKGEKQTLIDVLVARRAIERETTYLATLNVTEESIKALYGSIEKQRFLIKNNQLHTDEDKRFHELIALQSKNKVLYHALQIVIEDSSLSNATSMIRQLAGSELVVDHEEIVKAMAERNAEKAVKAMETHINQIIEDVKKI